MTMSDVSPESASAHDASHPAPDPGTFQPWPTGSPAGVFPPQPPPRRTRGPLIGFVAGVVAIALGLGGYLVVRNLENRNNKPVATSSQGRSGGITVAGHGIKMTFPHGWVNVPTSVNQFRQFINDFKAKYRHIPAALQREIENPQVLSSLAMLVVRFDGQGNETENLNALVTSSAVPPSEMVTQLKSGQGPAQFGATNVRYSVTSFGKYPGVLVSYTLRAGGVTLYGAQSYLDAASDTVVTTVTSQSSATSATDLRHIVGTLRFT
jgi:hypothetical protein